MSRHALSFFFCALGACHGKSGGSQSTAIVLARSAGTERVSAAAEVEPPPPWAEALRAERYRDAERAFEALPAAAKQSAEVRFAWARTRFELGKPAEALPLLTGLEQTLPVISQQIEELRDKLLLAAGPPSEAARRLEARGDALSLGKASQAWLEAGDAERALKLAERGLVGLGKGRGAHEREVRLRFARGLAAEKLGKTSLMAGDLHFVAIEAPLSEEAKTASVKLAQLGDKSPLSASDHVSRARALAAAGRVSDVELELSFIEPLAAQALRAGVPASLRGTALFNAHGDYAEAAKLFEQAAQLGTEDVAKELFYAAKSRARLQDDRGAEAGYQLVMQRFGTTLWAEHAELAIARIHLAAGSFDAAASAYARYLSKRGARARFFEEASYERAVALLSANHPKDAAALLSHLAQRSKDPRTEATLRELGAVALSMDGKSDEAAAAFKDVIVKFPPERKPLSCRITAHSKPRGKSWSRSARVTDSE